MAISANDIFQCLVALDNPQAQELLLQMSLLPDADSAVPDALEQCPDVDTFIRLLNAPHNRELLGLPSDRPAQIIQLDNAPLEAAANQAKYLRSLALHALVRLRLLGTQYNAKFVKAFFELPWHNHEQIEKAFFNFLENNSSIISEVDFAKRHGLDQLPSQVIVAQGESFAKQFHLKQVADSRDLKFLGDVVASTGTTTKDGQKKSTKVVLGKHFQSTFNYPDGVKLPSGVRAIFMNNNEDAAELRRAAGERMAKLMIDDIKLHTADSAGRLLLAKLLSTPEPNAWRQLLAEAACQRKGFKEFDNALNKAGEDIISRVAANDLGEEIFNKFFNSLLSDDNRPPQGLDRKNYYVRKAVYNFVSFVNNRTADGEKIDVAVRNVLAAKDGDPLVKNQLEPAQRKRLFGDVDIDFSKLKLSLCANLFDRYSKLHDKLKAEIARTSVALNDPQLKGKLEPPPAVLDVLFGVAAAISPKEVEEYRKGAGENPSNYSQKSWDATAGARKLHDPAAEDSERPVEGTMRQLTLQALDLVANFVSCVDEDRGATSGEDKAHSVAKNAAGTAQYAVATYAALVRRVEGQLKEFESELNQISKTDEKYAIKKAKCLKLIVVKDALEAREKFFQSAFSYYLQKSNLLAENENKLTEEYKAQLDAMAASMNLNYRDANLNWDVLINAKMRSVEDDPRSVEYVVSMPPDLAPDAKGFKNVIAAVDRNTFVVGKPEEDENGVKTITVDITRKGSEEKAKVTYDPGPKGSDTASVRASGTINAVVDAYVALYQASGLANKDGCFYIDPNSVELKRGGQLVSKKERDEFNAAFEKAFTQAFGASFDKTYIDAKMQLPPSARQPAWMGRSREFVAAKEEATAAAPTVVPR